VKQSVFGKHIPCLINYLGVSICLSLKERRRQPLCVMQLGGGSFSLSFFHFKENCRSKSHPEHFNTTPGITASNLSTHTWDLTSVQESNFISSLVFQMADSQQVFLRFHPHQITKLIIM